MSSKKSYLNLIALFAALTTSHPFNAQAVFQGDLQVSASDEPAYDGFLIRRSANMNQQSAVTGVQDSAPNFSILSTAKQALKDLRLNAQGVRSVGSQGWLYVESLSSSSSSLASASAKSAGASTKSTPEEVQQTIAQLREKGYDVEPNYIYKPLATPNDPSYSNIRTAMQQISAPLAWEIFRGSDDVKVCVIDTGIQADHPDLSGHTRMVYNAMTNSMAQSGDDDVGHGTHCAGTIGAVGNNGIGITGVSWSVTLLGCKFLGVDGGSTADAIKCIRWCREQGAKITSNSWGREGMSQALTDEIRISQDADHLFIAAAGNDNANIDEVDYSPAGIDLPAVITVGALDSSDRKASFSNYGRKRVHLFAPGVQIYSTYPTNSYTDLDGTSMAAPHVAGAAALLWAFKPSASAAEIKNALMQGVDIVAGAAQSQTGGRLNLYKSLQILRGGSSPLQSPPPPPPPPRGGGNGGRPPSGTCKDYFFLCQAWAYSGYCAPWYSWRGFPISVLCAASCGECDQPPECNDQVAACPTWAAQGYCDPVWMYRGKNVATEVCPLSCGNCQNEEGFSVFSDNVVTPPVDITGVWSTGGGGPDIYIRYDVQEDAGYATWLANPPESMSIVSVGANQFTFEDYAGYRYLARATPSVADASVAMELIVGSGQSAQTWTKKESADLYFPRRYITQAGDTVASVARALGATTNSLLAANPFLEGVNPNAPLLVGLSLAVPGSSSSSRDGAQGLFDFTDGLSLSVFGDPSNSNGNGTAANPPPPRPPPRPSSGSAAVAQPAALLLLLVTSSLLPLLLAHLILLL